MAWEFLSPILTPAALRSVQADARPLLTLLLVIIGLALLVGLAFYISFVTGKAYPKKKDAKKGGLLGFGKS